MDGHRAAMDASIAYFCCPFLWTVALSEPWGAVGHLQFAWLDGHSLHDFVFVAAMIGQHITCICRSWMLAWCAVLTGSSWPVRAVYLRFGMCALDT